MVPVTREEFKIRSELEAVHLPTGTVFSAYPTAIPMTCCKASGRIGVELTCRPRAWPPMPSKSDAWHRSCCSSERIER